MAKHYLKRFLLTTFLGLLVMGLLSLQCLEIRKIRIKDLYRMDFVLYWLNSALYPLGINMSPQKVVIGKDGWLYLGDEYERTLTVTRTGERPEDRAVGEALGASFKEWDTWLSKKGVKVFRVMVGPNKKTVYADHMPVWAQPPERTAMDGMLDGARSELILDVRHAMLSARNSSKEPLYFKTDTHWNSFGASVAFREFTRQVHADAPEIVWPSDDAYRLVNVEERKGGDLAKFLWLQGRLKDQDPKLGIGRATIETMQYDYRSGRLLSEGGNPEVGAPYEPLLVNSSGACNKKKVLWLRDSYGTALSPFMAATFSEVVQIHWRPALVGPDKIFTELVAEWKPDYVFITVVERSMDAGEFRQPLAALLKE